DRGEFSFHHVETIACLSASRNACLGCQPSDARRKVVSINRSSSNPSASDGRPANWNPRRSSDGGKENSRALHPSASAAWRQNSGVDQHSSLATWKVLPGATVDRRES